MHLYSWESDFNIDCQLQLSILLYETFQAVKSSCIFGFYVPTGICMEALCSPRMSEPLESVITCLRALYTLLDSTEPRQMLMVDKSLAIELCNVLHR